MEQSLTVVNGPDGVKILVVDDQPAKLLSYEVVLAGVGATLVKASSACEAFECLLKNDIALILIDVCMPDIDGFELATLIREHPRFQRIAIIFVSAVMKADLHQLRGYELGAVDFIPVPVVPELLRAKVKVFLDLYRKTRQLERLNAELERQVLKRTADLHRCQDWRAGLCSSALLRYLAAIARRVQRDRASRVISSRAPSRDNSPRNIPGPGSSYRRLSRRWAASPRPPTELRAWSRRRRQHFDFGAQRGHSEHAGLDSCAGLMVGPGVLPRCAIRRHHWVIKSWIAQR